MHVKKPTIYITHYILKMNLLHTYTNTPITYILHSSYKINILYTHITSCQKKTITILCADAKKFINITPTYQHKVRISGSVVMNANICKSRIIKQLALALSTHINSYNYE